VSGYWVISDEALLQMLHLVSDGHDPDLVFAEYYANSEHEVSE
jgi:hypothetical protein